MGRKIRDLKGERFGALTVLEFAGKRNGRTYWLCECDCGSYKAIRTGDLTSGHSKSCGCSYKKCRVPIESKITHNMSKTRFYNVWRKMKCRCSNPNHMAYKHYGGRGIQVCERWLQSFECFKEDMFETYLAHIDRFGKRNTTLERVDVNGDYAPDNCKWATWDEQAKNKRKKVRRKLPADKIKKPIATITHESEV